MIDRLEIEGVHMKVDEPTSKYVIKKIAGLDRYMPKSIRGSVHGEVILKEDNTNRNNHCSCEVTLHLPKETINIQEATVNIFAAIDIVEAKLRAKIKKYKELHNSAKLSRRVFARLNLKHK